MNYTTIDISNLDSQNDYCKVAGRQGESNVRGIQFIVPSEYLTWNVSVETENAKGESKRYPVSFKQNSVLYKFRKKDLEAKGRLNLDLVLEKDDMVYKPFSGEFAVKKAICATDDWFDDVEIDLTGYALRSEIPKKISQLENDENYITKTNLQDEIDFALQTAKASGEFEGQSAYQIWLNEGNTGTESVFLESLKGNDGYSPIKGVDYFDGEKGNPFTYEDFTPEQLEALKGADGKTPIKGIDYFTEEDKTKLVDAVLASLPKAEEDEF